MRSAAPRRVCTAPRHVAERAGAAMLGAGSAAVRPWRRHVGSGQGALSLSNAFLKLGLLQAQVALIDRHLAFCCLKGSYGFATSVSSRGQGKRGAFPAGIGAKMSSLLLFLRGQALMTSLPPCYLKCSFILDSVSLWDRTAVRMLCEDVKVGAFPRRMTGPRRGAAWSASCAGSELPGPLRQRWAGRVSCGQRCPEPAARLFTRASPRAQ